MNLLKQAGQALATFAPTVATALGGPLAGVAITSLEKVFGIDPSVPAADKRSAIEAGLVAATPDQIIALRKAEQDFQVQIKTLGISEEKLIYDDRAAARAREMAVKDNTPRILAYAVVALVVLAEGSLLLFGQPKAVDGVVLGRVLGTLDAALMLVLSYYFGSSIGSKEKDSALAAIAKQS